MQSRSFRKPKGENIWKEAYEAEKFSGQYSRSERHGGADAPAWANVDEMLAQYGATIDNIVDEVLFVTDMEAALGRRGQDPTRSVLRASSRGEHYRGNLRRTPTSVRAAFGNHVVKISISR